MGMYPSVDSASDVVELVADLDAVNVNNNLVGFVEVNEWQYRKRYVGSGRGGCKRSRWKTGVIICRTGGVCEGRGTGAKSNRVCNIFNPNKTVDSVGIGDEVKRYAQKFVFEVLLEDKGFLESNARAGYLKNCTAANCCIEGATSRHGIVLYHR